MGDAASLPHRSGGLRVLVGRFIDPDPQFVFVDDPDEVPADIGRIVHEADLGDDLYDAPEAPGLDRLIRGISLVAADDDELLTVTRSLLDGLYELSRRSHLHEGPGDER